MSPDPSRGPDATAAHVPPPPSTVDATGAYEATPGPGAGGPPADLPDVPGYHVTGEIARGGMGRVLAARDPAFGREVAVKVLLRPDADAARLFARESYLTGRLTHPGIPPAHQLGTLADGSPFLAMKLVRGRTLADLLKARPGPAHDLPRFVGVFEQVCQAVGYAHAEGVVHRDIKPANVMVGAFGEVQVMDWGLAFEAGPGAEAAGATGTPAYMAPEQARGEPVDARADVFALGGVLGEVLTGRRPFPGTTGAEAMRRAVAGDVADALARLDACGADRELIELAKRCLSPAREARPADGTAVAAEVAAYRAGVEERLRTAERERAAADARAVEQRKRKRLQLALAGLAVVLVAGAGAAAVWRVDEEGRKRLDAIRRQAEQDRAAADERERLVKATAGVGEQLDEARARLDAGEAGRAEVFLDQAARRAAEAGVTAHAARLAAYRADLALLRDLDAADEVRWTHDGGYFASAGRVTGLWAGAFRRYGIEPGTTPAAEAAARLSASPVRSAAFEAMYWWLKLEPASPVRAVLDLADPDPARADLRRALAAGDRAGVAAVVRRPAWDTQPAWAIRVAAGSADLSPDARRAVLTPAYAARQNDFGLVMELGATYPINTPAGAGDRLRWFQAAVALRPANAAAHGGLGTALGDAGQPANALAAHRTAVRFDPKSAPAHNSLGVALKKSGDPAAAEAAYRTAIGLDPGYVLPRYNLGSLLRQNGDRAGAEAAFREAIRLDSGFAQAHLNLGELLGAAGDRAGAEACFREAVRLDPTDFTGHYNLAAVLAEKGDLRGAVAGYKEAARLNPASGPAHNNLGNALRDLGDLDAAVPSLREAVRLDPTNVLAHNNLGATLRDRGDADGAAACFREAIRLDPKHPWAHNNLGLVAQSKGDPAAAVAHCREAIRLDPRFAAAHFNLGNALRDKGDAAGAVAAFRESIRLDGKVASVHFNLGLVLGGGGELDAAAAAFREAVRLNPRHAMAHANLGAVRELALDFDEAEAAYREAVRHDPGLAVAHAILGDLCRRRGRPADAADAYRAALAAQPNLAPARDGLDFCLRVLRGEVPTAPPPRPVKR